jgi:DNA-binding transcriptional MerR regulator
MEVDDSYKNKKVITIGVVSELTGLSERKIRYYEERKLVFPARTSSGTRKYSFLDIETLVAISNAVEDGVSTFEIRQNLINKGKDIDKEMIQGQVNAHFKLYKNN